MRPIFLTFLFLAPLSYAAAAAQQTVGVQEPNDGGELSLEAQDLEVALSRLVPADGYQVNLFASEKEFPVRNPVAMTFDARGRLWVATMPSYPHNLPGEPPDDRIIILEDTDGDGKADRHIVFADGLYLPAGFELGDGGVYVAQQPNLVFLKDTDGDDVADERHVILNGFGTEDSHHAISVFTWGPGGGLYFQEGTFHHTQVETPRGPVRLENAGVFRFEPKTFKLSVFVSYGFANPWGHVFDGWGQNFIADASNGNNYYALPFSGHVDHPRKHPPMKEFTPTKVRPTSGCEIVSSRHFPDGAQGNFLINNVIGFHGIKQYEVIEEGSGFTAKEIEPLLRSSDINFRPVDLKFGPDGALYVVDWFNPLVGHMQYSIRDPRRDHNHGRIWRITYKNKPLLNPPQIAGRTPEQLLDLLREPENRTRYRVRVELRGHDPKRVAAALREWMAGLDRSDPDYEHHLLEALWVYQHLNIVEPKLLERLLQTPDYRARAAATRVIRSWQDRLADPLKLLQMQTEDEHPRVRLEAVVALSFFRTPEAAESALEVVRRPLDYYLDYGLKETLATLKPYWTPVLSANEPFAVENPEGFEYLLDTLSSEELVNLADNRLFYEKALLRPGLEVQYREKALGALARLNGSDSMKELLAAIERAGKMKSEAAGGLIELLVRRPAATLASARQDIEKMAAGGRGEIQRGALAALLIADGNAGRVWDMTLKSRSVLLAFLEAVALLPDPELRTSLRSHVKGVIEEVQASGGAAHREEIQRAAIDALSRIPKEELETFSMLTPFIDSDALRNDAIHALRRLPRDNWPQQEAGPLVKKLLAYASSVPAEERSRPPFLALTEFGRELASLMPADQAEAAQKSFDDLVVQMVYIRAVPEEIRFDKLDFRVEAGRPVEIVFVNPDVMPHNLLIVEPGALVEVSLAAEAMATEPDAFERAFVPDSPKLLFATPLLKTGETYRLRFMAPDPGNYPYVCTFPGHWRTMNGMMYVSRPQRP